MLRRVEIEVSQLVEEGQMVEVEVSQLVEEGQMVEEG